MYMGRPFPQTITGRQMKTETDETIEHIRMAFACAAMAGLVSSPSAIKDPPNVARRAVEYADALMEALRTTERVTS